MAKKLTIIAVMIAFISIFGSNASALTINDPGVVGGVHGDLGNSNVSTETVAAEFILDMIAPASDSNGPAAGGVACDISTQDGCYATSNTEYSGDLSGGVQGASNDNTVDAGFEYALAKYDGQNGGYVLFYLGGVATTLPSVSNTLWGAADTDQYALSHYTAFNGTPTVPDGGTTLILLGAALGGLGLVRRRFNA